MDVLLEEMTSALETSVGPPVGILERTVIVSVAELICWEVLVSLSPGIREDTDSVSILVVSEEPDVDMKAAVSIMAEEVTIGDVALDGPESAGTEECDSSPELVVLTLFTAVILEM